MQEPGQANARTFERARSPRTARTVWGLSALLLLSTSGQTFVGSVLPSYGRVLRLSETEVALLLSASSIMLVATSRAWGGLSERRGRSLVVLIGLMGYALGTGLFLAVSAAGDRGLLTGSWLFALLLASRLIQAGLSAAATPAITAWIADVTQPKERVRAIGVLSACATLGMTVGPLVAGALAGFGLRTPFYFFLVVFSCASAILWRLPQAAERAPRSGDTGAVSFLDARIRFYIASGVLIFSALALLQFALGFYLQDVLDLSVARAAQLAGGSLGLAMATSAVTQLSLGRRVAWSPEVRIRVGLPITAAGYVVLGIFGDELVVSLAMILAGFGMGLVMPAFRAGATLATDAGEQGSVAGIVSACAPIGYVIGPLLGAQLYRHGPAALFLTTAVILIPPVFWRPRVARA